MSMTTLWIHYSIWFISLVIIGHVSRIGEVQERAFIEGEQEVISNLKGYFNQNPGHYESYQKWM